MVNQRAEAFSNIQVFASSPWFQSQPGKMRKLRIESKLIEDSQVPMKAQTPIICSLVLCTTLIICAVVITVVQRWKVQAIDTLKSNGEADKNLDYGTYYCADGDRRLNVMEVTLKLFPYYLPNQLICKFHFFSENVKK